MLIEMIRVLLTLYYVHKIAFWPFCHRWFWRGTHEM